MNWVKAHWKQIATMVLSLGVGGALHFGKITATQAMEVGGFLALVGIHLPAVTYGAAFAAAQKAKAPAKVPPLPIIMLLALCGCGAPTAQTQTLIGDGAKVGVCIIANVLGGNTDPAAIVGSCGGATVSLIVDVINEFESKQDAGTPSPNLALAKQKAVTELAKKVPGK